MTEFTTTYVDCENCHSLIKINLMPPEKVIVNGETLDWCDFECNDCGEKTTVSLVELKKEANMF